MPDEVLFHAATDQQIDERQILNNIIVAEERWIANVLGDSFYEAFLDAKNKTVTAGNRTELVAAINASLTANNLPVVTEADIPVGTIINAIEFVENEWMVKLWNRFLWKLTAECVDVATTIPSWVRHTSAGQMKNNPNVIGGNGSNSATAELKEVELKVNRAIQDRIDPLMERMKMWICRNQSNLGSYKFNCGGYNCGEDGDLDGISHIRKTNFITNIYDDRDDEKLLRIL